MAPSAPEAGKLKVHVCLQVQDITGQPQKASNPPSQQLLSHPGPLLPSVPSFNDDMDMS